MSAASEPHGTVSVDGLDLAAELAGGEARAVAPDVAAYALRLGDDALILAQNLCGWIARAPELEEDVALGNIALDLLGHVHGRVHHGTGEQAGRAVQLAHALLVEVAARAGPVRAGAEPGPMDFLGGPWGLLRGTITLRVSPVSEFVAKGWLKAAAFYGTCIICTGISSSKKS